MDVHGKRVLVTGGSGFIGTRLVRKLCQHQAEVLVLSRNPADTKAKLGSSVEVSASFAALYAKQPEVVINLAGEPLADRRWNPERKSQFRASRIQLTQEFYDVAKQQQYFPKVWVNGSAIGFYSAGGEAQLTEDAPQGADFAASLCADWEAVARQFTQHTTRVVAVRIGLVLGEGGMLKAMGPAFKAGVGGPLGNGLHWQSWIHVDDLVNILLFSIEQDNLEGVVNGVAPNPVRNKDFAKALGQALKRPAVLSMPAMVLKLLFGELAELMLCSQKVVSTRLVERGFGFEYTDLDAALAAIYYRSR